MRQRAGIIACLRLDLREGHVARGVDKFSKVGVGDWRAVDPEAFDTDAMNRSLFGIVGVGTHPELTALDPHHFVCEVCRRGSITGVC
jgi:hypothetical protein